MFCLAGLWVLCLCVKLIPITYSSIGKQEPLHVQWSSLTPSEKCLSPSTTSRVVGFRVRMTRVIYAGGYGISGQNWKRSWRNSWAPPKNLKCRYPSIRVHMTVDVDAPTAAESWSPSLCFRDAAQQMGLGHTAIHSVRHVDQTRAVCDSDTEVVFRSQSTLNAWQRNLS